jgi:hypothetical protein
MCWNFPLQKSINDLILTEYHGDLTDNSKAVNRATPQSVFEYFRKFTIHRFIHQ